MIRLDGESLTIDDVVRVAREDEPVALTSDARERVRASRERVESVVDTDEAVYGVTTGFGDLVNTRIPRDKREELQANLVRSHATGAGRPLEREEVRALLLTRANALSKGYSGIRESVVDLLIAMLNEGVHPVVPSRGSLGASGDLAPLAHVAVVLIGEGEADYEGEWLSGGEALARAGFEPVTLQAKEGLALINGTQLTVGLAALLVHDAERLLLTADAAGALTTEVTMGSVVACDPAIQRVRPHSGQAESAANVQRFTRDSAVVESHRNCDRVQDAYSIRCLPQVHGAVRDAVAHLREAVEIELNSATDNPLVFPNGEVDPRASGGDAADIVSGGNFHGAPLSHRLDYVAGALTDLASISERRTDRLLNPHIQEAHLPPYLARNAGTESGLMIAQYTAASLLAECRATGRAGTDSTPVSGGQEDHVSMSATAAYGARRVLENVRQVVAVELLCAAEAAEYVEESLGTGTTALYEAVRELVPPLSGDRSLAGDIETLAALVVSEEIENRIAD
ncbi:histidine ammonia-lyase [Natronomonas sp. EA1]|uniref:histidine ammonia-lyase n=1 Tax=Natronomonas sp. EA1 TaxID=3421655 RepID=UPI003EBFC432